MLILFGDFFVCAVVLGLFHVCTVTLSSQSAWDWRMTFLFPGYQSSIKLLKKIWKPSKHMSKLLTLILFSYPLCQPPRFLPVLCFYICVLAYMCMDIYIAHCRVTNYLVYFWGLHVGWPQLCVFSAGVGWPLCHDRR